MIKDEKDSNRPSENELLRPNTNFSVWFNSFIIVRLKLQPKNAFISNIPQHLQPSFIRIFQDFPSTVFPVVICFSLARLLTLPAHQLRSPDEWIHFNLFTILPVDTQQTISGLYNEN